MLNSPWRDSALPIRFFMLEAYAAIPVLLVIIWFSWVTLLLAIITGGIFWFMERRGLGTRNALRALRAWLHGPDRPARQTRTLTYMS